MTESKSIYILIATDPDLWQNSIYAVSHNKDRLIDIAQDLINNCQQLRTKVRSL